MGQHARSADRSTDVPRKGNVDRNIIPRAMLTGALYDVPRKGNVDRNQDGKALTVDEIGTFPARGTWIEMAVVAAGMATGVVDVPRKGNVDRNVLVENDETKSI